MKRLLLLLLVSMPSATCVSQTMGGLCIISASQRTDKPSTAQVMLSESNCDKDSGGCMEMSNSSMEWRRWTGITQQALQADGAQLSAHATGDAGDLACEGIVHDGALSGRFRFNASPVFAGGMAAMGFDGITPRKQLSFLMLDITPAWAREMKELGVTELSTSKLSGLRALHVDGNYIHAMAAAGYPELRAGKLTEMKAVGVTPDKVREAKALGFQPTESELIQMSIFKIDRPFVDRMRARGLNDLTLAKLIKIKIFKLEE
ncbi:hypothetical protein [Terriglobus roseus]|uniref:Uncharacterized protein n=1 Tax=Terriglobus roseus TaxID=392734 RepID=A0A1H4JQZ8_9BACT|nr:hypothetical protein [Terriglobus roseus]SEB48547.1 hypothetical protein SAMN05443244_0759 [Terriglobus roseus]